MSGARADSNVRPPFSSYMKGTSENQEAAYLEAFRAHADNLYRHVLFRLSNKEHAEEITQEAFLKTWDYLREGGEVQNFKSFLYRIVNNLIIDEYRKHKSSSLDQLLEDDTGAFEARMSEGSVHETEETLDAALLHEKIRAEIPKLQESYREVITLRYIDGLQPHEIAHLLGESENAISVRIHRGVAKLRTLCIKENL